MSYCILNCEYSKRIYEVSRRNDSYMIEIAYLRRALFQ